MQHFRNYFVQILVIKSKCQGGAHIIQEGKNIQGAAVVGEAVPPLNVHTWY